MKRDFRRPGALMPASPLLFLLWLSPLAQADEPAAGEATEEGVLSEVVVTSQRREQSRQLHPGNIAKLDAAEMERVQHQHVHELMREVPGAWVVRGSGQESQTAIRSPVLTGGGSCAAFLLLEDGIPVRPSGFCNANQFLELDTGAARSIEVIRGPGNALFGSNALHGIVNVLMPMPGATAEPRISLEGGANGFLRARASLPLAADAPWVANAVYAKDDGFRDDSGYRQAKLHLKRRWVLADSDLNLGFTATSLDQDTAGFVYGKDSYKDPALNRGNPNPGAFRDAASQRLYALWSKQYQGFTLDVRPYLRRSRLEFMHFAQPGKPVEENGQVSAGVMSAVTYEVSNYTLISGLDFEWADVFVRQTQAGQAEGPPRQRETRPQGKHYDYEVTATSAAVFMQSEYRVRERLTLGAGLRLEFIHYDYDNRMLAGNTRDDGSTCSFGGCLFTRPADRSDRFTSLAPNLSAGYRLGDRSEAYVSLARGFRAPQMTELYRLQSGQQVSDLDVETMDSLEVGLRSSRETWTGELSVFAMNKRDSVFRDAEGFNVSGARSRHRGVEAEFDWSFRPAWRLAANVSYARHTYDFDYAPRRGEQFESGKDIDTAPRWLASARLRYNPANRGWAELEWSHLGEYFLEPQNRYTYPGHSLLNLRGGVRVSPALELLARLNNLAGEFVADRADYGGGDYRYLPGRGRELFVELRYYPLSTQE